MGHARLSLVLPFYNEEANVTRVIHDLENAFQRERLNEYEIVGVNNGSWDRTGELLKTLHEKDSRVKIVTVSVNKGLGFGILQGFNASEGDYIGFHPGDGQIGAGDVVNVWRKLVREDLDLCKVRRVVREDGIQRRVISLIFNFLCRVMFGIRSDDVNGIPKIMKREALEKMALVSRDWFIDTEIMIKAAQFGLKIGEENVHFLKRKGGKSSINYRALLQFLKNMMLCRIKGCPMEKKPAPSFEERLESGRI